MVSDKDIAREIREAAPGNTLADVKAAWACVRGRLASQDDDRTETAFGIAAHIIGGSFVGVTSSESRAALAEIKDEIAAALAAARGGEQEKLVPTEGDRETALNQAREILIRNFNEETDEEWIEQFANDFADTFLGHIRQIRIACDMYQKERARIKALEAAGREMIAAVVQITGMYDRRAAGKISEGQVVVITEAKRKLAALVAEEVEKDENSGVL